MLKCQNCSFLLLLLFLLSITSPHLSTGQTGQYCDSAHLVCRSDWVTRSPERSLQKWLDKLKRNPDCFLTRHSGDVERTDKPLGEGKPGGRGVEEWVGEVDRVGRFDGEGVLNLRSCEGQSGCEDGLGRVEGVWVEGNLEGQAVFFVVGKHTELVFMVGGVKHGVGLMYLDRERKYLARITLYKSGERVGPDWDLTMGQGLDVSKHYQPTTQTVGTLDPTSHWGGGALYNNTVWLYPGYKVGMTGLWDEGVMVEGREAELERVRCREGVMEAFTISTSSNIHKFDPPTKEQICSDPHSLDPYEKTRVSVEYSRLSGEGLFSVQDTPKNTLVAYFCGYKVPVDWLETNWTASVGGEDIANSLMPGDTRLEEFIYRKSYLIALDKEHDLDMPPEIGKDVRRYQATLGHKVNHWFKPNCYFGWAVHPRFGRIRSIVTLREVKKGEELTVDYGYRLEDRTTPGWYTRLYKHVYGQTV